MAELVTFLNSIHIFMLARMKTLKTAGSRLLQVALFDISVDVESSSSDFGFFLSDTEDLYAA